MAHFALTVVDMPPSLRFARIRASFSCEICGRLIFAAKVYMSEFVMWVSAPLTANHSKAPQKKGRGVVLCELDADGLAEN